MARYKMVNVLQRPIANKKVEGFLCNNSWFDLGLILSSLVMKTVEEIS